MSLWWKSRAWSTVALVMGVCLTLMVTPVSQIATVPSPAGAAVIGAVLLALPIPITLAWACQRGDPRLERASQRPLRWMDLGLVAGGSAVFGGAILSLSVAGVSTAGPSAVRALMTFLGLTLGVRAILGWEKAALAPALYFAAVALLGRGEDVARPAAWAFIAGADVNPSTWIAAAMVLLIGAVMYVAMPDDPSGAITSA